MAGSVFLVKDGSVFKVQNWNLCFDAPIVLGVLVSFLGTSKKFRRHLSGRAVHCSYLVTFAKIGLGKIKVSPTRHYTHCKQK